MSMLFLLPESFDVSLIITFQNVTDMHYDKK